jgi:hypothetical protein
VPKYFLREIEKCSKIKENIEKICQDNLNIVQKVHMPDWSKEHLQDALIFAG